MSDAEEVRALIAEARHETSKIRFGGRQTGRVALSSELQLIARLADALEAAHAEPDDDEREALKQAITHGYWERTGYRVTWEHIGPLMDAIFAHGFRRSARVPVSRDELAAWFKRIMPVLHEPLATAVAMEWAEKFLAEHDVSPKADRKAADSGGAGR